VAPIALVGAGRMGLPIVRSLLRAGHPVRVLDRRPEVEHAVREAGAVPAADADALLTGARVLFTVLPGSPELREVMSGLLGRVERGTTWIDLTSTAPDVGAELAAAARAREVAALDAPLGGGPATAEAASLTLYVGGDAALLEEHRPLLAAFADSARIHHCGASGTGYLTKLLVNLLWFGQAAAVTEALLLGQRAGLTPDVLRRLLADGPAASAFLADHVPALLAGDYLPSFGLDRIVEELDAIASSAAAQGSPFVVSGAVTALYRDALAHYGSVDGELLGAAYLEHLAGHRLSGGD